MDQMSMSARIHIPRPMNRMINEKEITKMLVDCCFLSAACGAYIRAHSRALRFSRTLQLKHGAKRSTFVITLNKLVLTVCESGRESMSVVSKILAALRSTHGAIWVKKGHLVAK